MPQASRRAPKVCRMLIIMSNVKTAQPSPNGWTADAVAKNGGAPTHPSSLSVRSSSLNLVVDFLLPMSSFSCTSDSDNHAVNHHFTTHDCPPANTAEFVES